MVELFDADFHIEVFKVSGLNLSHIIGNHDLGFS
jgi:hypothetical protein